ncbi:MAG: peptidoglycan DD-metalloendopeptidase family protein [Parcubacteria group bacterium]|nr:peptidoglycan DD-metalloendopeptidase family protein [Parcubacteria group bacterium]MCR4342811.1 peptidoglycan DD-metalloendopeptidase family protein [Patescibacteria group bacterium]
MAKETPGENLQNMPLLQAALNSDPSPAKGGGDITIINGSALFSDTGPYGSMADIEDAKPESGEISLYVVRDGDSLSQIAKMFNVSISTIIWANDIKKGDLIKPGQTLLILPISGVKYIVKEGDTVKGIATKFKGDADEIIQFNGLADSEKLVVGSEVIIPNGEDSSYVPASSVKTVVVRGSGGPSYSGYYLRPVENAVRSQGLHGYNGVDLAAPTGTPILASAAGDVIVSRSAGWNGGYGKYIVIKHSNGTQTLYSHLSEVIVSTGWHVVQGQIIGYVGSTGKSTGPHLHFEIRGAKNPF